MSNPNNVSFFGINENQIRVETKTQKVKTLDTLEEKIAYEVNEKIKEVLAKNNAKHYTFVTIEPDGKDVNGEQVYKRVKMTKYCLPIPCKQNGKDGFKMFYVDTWKKRKPTEDYKEAS